MKNKNKSNNNSKLSNTENYISDDTKFVNQNSKLKNGLKIFERTDLTENQKKFLKLAEDKTTKVIFISGPAGSSKTFISIMAALKLLNEKKVSDLIYLRSVVESSDSKMGFLPGSKEDKMCPYLQPLMDKLEELLPKSDILTLIKEQRVSGHPINFLRGLSWNAKAVIMDEAQNCSYKELFTFITRIGEFSKVFIMGDPDQSDIGKSGFSKIMSLFNDEESVSQGIKTFTFTSDDIVRSGLVKYIIEKSQRTNLKNQ